jgi:hypothetical protein
MVFYSILSVLHVLVVCLKRSSNQLYEMVVCMWCHLMLMLCCVTHIYVLQFEFLYFKKVIK